MPKPFKTFKSKGLLHVLIGISKNENILSVSSKLLKKSVIDLMQPKP